MKLSRVLEVFMCNVYILITFLPWVRDNLVQFTNGEIIIGAFGVLPLISVELRYERFAAAVHAVGVI